MIHNYLKIALRSLAANKTFSFINIVGLSIGIAACVLILMVTLHEFSYDHFHVNGKRIFRAEKEFTRDGRRSLFANPQFAPSLMQTDPRVENYVRTFHGAGRILSSNASHLFYEDQLMFADTSFFSVFSFPLVRGERRFLAAPSTAIVTESIARKYFNTTDVIGKVLTLDKIYPLSIVGVAKDAPVNSTIQFGVIASFGTLMEMPFERDIVLNNSSGFPTYVLLKNENDLATVTRSIETIQYTNKDIIYSLAPMFENHFNFYFGSTATTRYAYTFLSLAALILMLALINYMNLTTARASTRAREVGVRKVIGANRKSLLIQFYFESAVSTSISFVLSIVLVELFRPQLANLIGITLDTQFLTSPMLYTAIIGVLIVSVLVAGSYPAIVLPSFKPVEVLKGNPVIQGKSWLRKVLTVFQFSVSVSLAICAAIMIRQLSFIGHFDTGIQRSRVIGIQVKTFSPGQRQQLKATLLARPDIDAVGTASLPLYRHSMNGVALMTSPFNNEKVGAKWIVADRSFLSTLQIDQKWQTDSSQRTVQLLNESAATAFGFSETSPTHSITLGGDHIPAVTGEVNGVIKDFNFESLRNPIQPLILSVVADSARYIGDNPTLYVRMSKASTPSDVIPSISKVYNQFAIGSPFSYYFLDDAFNEQQTSDQHLQQVFTIFASIAAVIACMGLFGLVTFSSERRKKELSLRKLLGASIQNIVVLVSSEMAILILISVVIAVPAALYVAGDWLAGFSYKAPITFINVAAPTAIAFLVAMFVVGIQGVITALKNPATNLKSE